MVDTSLDTSTYKKLHSYICWNYTQFTTYHLSTVQHASKVQGDAIEHFIQITM